MRFFNDIRKGKVAVTIVTRTLLFALMVSFFSTMFAASIGCGGGARTVSKTAVCRDCCSQMTCCSVNKSNVPAKPQPLGTSRETSSQEIVNFPPPALPLLHGFAFEAKPVRFFPLCDSPHYNTAPLAQGCIQLI